MNTFRKTKTNDKNTRLLKLKIKMKTAYNNKNLIQNINKN